MAFWLGFWLKPGPISRLGLASFGMVCRGSVGQGKKSERRNQRGKKTNFDQEQVTNDGESAVILPYRAEITIEGVAPILFHRWSCEAVAAKAAAAKGSKAKKTDDWESYLYRDSTGAIAIPGEYLRQSIIEASKFRQDPRSPRKSAKDLFKAGIISLTDLAATGANDPDYLDQRRVCVMRAAVTRVRSALNAGWSATFQMQVQTPEYISPQTLNAVIADAGRLVGVGDFRPSYERFVVTSFTILEEASQ